MVSAGASGLARALDDPLEGVAHQRCLCHTITPLADSLVCGPREGEAAAVEDHPTRRATRQRKKTLVAEAGWVDDGERAAAIRARAEVFRDHWQGRAPKAVANWLREFAKTCASLTMDFPLSLASLSRTTNRRERLQQERRRTQRDIGMVQSAQGGETRWYLLSRRETAKQRAALSSRR